MIRKATNKDEARVLLIKINSMFLEYLKPVSEEKVAEAMTIIANAITSSFCCVILSSNQPIELADILTKDIKKIVTMNAPSIADKLEKFLEKKRARNDT